ncbi:MAG: LPS export ABC transporter permease LptF [Nitrospirota bacterium]|nr:LPS export ABC transporter permease LptF [Nitrospirota bacterium]
MNRHSAPVLGILDRYILKELATPFLLGLFICTFILLVGRILKLTELVINKGAEVSVLGQLLGYMMPSFLSMTMPMAVLVAAVVAFNRLSSDSEIVVLRAGGVSLYRIIFPVLLLASIIYIATTFIVIQVAPHANRSFKELLFSVVKSQGAFSVTEGIFCTSFPGIVLYADKVPEGDKMEGVFISDERNPEKPYVVTAKNGRIENDPAGMGVVLKLQDGNIHVVKNNRQTYQKLTFVTNDIVLDLTKSVEGGVSYGKKDLTLSELRQEIATKKAAGDKKSLKESLTYQIEFHKKFAFPFAAVVFALIGAPLGITSRRSGKVAGFATSIAVLIVYYIVESAGERLCTEGKLPAVVALWFPNVLFCAVGGYLLYRAAIDAAFNIPSPIRWFKQLIGGRRAI